jgi:parallel beta-helix repeat protein
MSYCNVTYGFIGVFLWGAFENNITYSNVSYHIHSGINVWSSGSNNISNNIVTNVENDGIKVGAASYTNITNNIVTDNLYGIHFEFNSAHCIVSGNNISNNYDGFFAETDIENVTVESNFIQNDHYGLYMDDTTNFTISQNTFVNDDIFIVGDDLPNFNSHEITSDNTVNGKPLYFYKDTSGLIIDGIPAGEIILANCSNFEIMNLQLDNTDVGMELAYSDDIDVTNVTLISNDAHGLYSKNLTNSWIQDSNSSSNDLKGMYLVSSSGNLIINNEASGNIEEGIFLEFSNVNVITFNNVYNNGEDGIYLTFSSNNTLYQNTVSPNNGGGITLFLYSDYNDIRENNVSFNFGMGIYLRTSSYNNVAFNWEKFIALFDSKYNIISNNTIRNNIYGIRCLQGSLNNTIRYNDISTNNYGMQFQSSSNDNIIEDNNVYSNTEYGIKIDSSSNNNTFSSNDIYSNVDYGVYVLNSYGNLFQNNNISNNTGDGLSFETSPNNYVINNIIKGNDNNGVYVKWTSDYEIIGNNASENLNYGIYLDSSTDNLVKDNDVYNNKDGIYVTGSDNTIEGNNVTESGYGIWMAFSTDNTISDNYLAFNNYGVRYVSSSYTNITGNNISFNNIDGIFLQTVSDWNTISQNDIMYNGQTQESAGIYLKNSPENNTISNNRIIANNGFGIEFESALFNTIVNNTISQNIKHGIYGYSQSNNNEINQNVMTGNDNGTYLDDSYFNTFSRNNISQNSNGLYFILSSNNTIENNTITLNTRNGTYLEYSNDTKIFNNDIGNNNYGIYIGSNSQNTLIYHNNILENTIQAYDLDPVNNSWHHPGLLEGNFWSDYLGLDDGSGAAKHAISADGIGDTLIPHPNTDYDFYPLIETVDVEVPQITNLQLPDLTLTSNNLSIISADYFDLSGINTSSVVLIIDGIDETLNATVTSGGISFTPIVAFSDGVHNIYLEVRDDSFNQNMATAIWSFTVDSTPPQTTILAGSPTHLSGPVLYVKSATSFSFISTDGAGSGVESTWYKIDSGGAWTTYTGSFSVTSSGAHVIYYNSTDNIGNTEITQSLDIFVDDSPPQTSLGIGSPYYEISGNYYVGQKTPFNLTSMDLESGVNETWYRIDNLGPWIKYQNSFNLSGLSGLHTIFYYTEDNLTNSENINSLSVFVDSDTPQSEITVVGSSYGSNPVFVRPTSQFNITAADFSGVDSIWYKIDGSSWFKYPGNFVILSPGLHTIYYNSTDIFGNMESPKSIEIYVDDASPVSTLGISGPQLDILGTTYVTSYTVFSLTTDDGLGSGIAKLEYRIDGGTWISYTTPFSIISPGVHAIEFNATDNLGNSESTQALLIYVDDASPATSIVIGSPSIILSGVTYVNSSTLFTLSAGDGAGGVGVNSTFYNIDEGIWQSYNPFTLVGYLSGYHMIGYYSQDELGNIEIARYLVVFMDEENPVADSGFDISSGEGSTVIFNGLGSTDNGQIKNWTWTFTDAGNPITLYGATPSYTFMTTGVYTITLEVKDALDHNDTDILSVTIITDLDVDSDGLLDSWEISNFGDLSQNATDNPDNDDFTNIQEFYLGTDPNLNEDTDTDDDGLPDTWEITSFGDLNETASGDPDDDGYTNIQEFYLGLDPLFDNNPDHDSDGLPDYWEIDNFGDLNQYSTDDPDGDSFTNIQEYHLGSDPNVDDVLDHDFDGLLDIWEIDNFGDLDETATGDPDNDDAINIQEFYLGTDPLVSDIVTLDSDFDGLPDVWEFEHFGDLSEPADGDPDSDDSINIQEFYLNTDPMVNENPDPDSDSDGLLDSWEIVNFGNLDQSGDGDYDSDGYSNVQELYLETDPTVPEPKEPTESEETPLPWWLGWIVAIIILILLLVALLTRKKPKGIEKELGGESIPMEKEGEFEDELVTEEPLEDFEVEEDVEESHNDFEVEERGEPSSEPQDGIQEEHGETQVEPKDELGENQEEPSVGPQDDIHEEQGETQVEPKDETEEHH